MKSSLLLVVLCLLFSLSLSLSEQSQESTARPHRHRHERGRNRKKHLEEASRDLESRPTLFGDEEGREGDPTQPPSYLTMVYQGLLDPSSQIYPGESRPNHRTVVRALLPQQIERKS